MTGDVQTSFEAPYPLQSRFNRIVIPGLLILTVLIGLSMSFGSSWLTQKIYLEISENRAGIVNRALSEEVGATWQELQEQTDPVNLFKREDGQNLLEALRSEVRELGLAHLKVYGRDGIILYSSEESQIGSFDASDGYRKAERGVRSLIEKTLPDQSQLYELYVRVPNGSYNTVMELYEPVDYLNALLVEIIIPATALPVGVLLFLGWAIRIFVHRAQDDINYRTDLLTEFRTRLQRLVSAQAVTSLRDATGKGEVTSKRVRATILFSDVRGFTNFSESETPENVVAFLNRSLGIVIDAVHDQGGDVDKMIGDAVLAHFQGEGAEDRALEAALRAQEEMQKAGLPRGIGIGIYSGDVVAGTVGAADRMDFTVIGDTVNVASRLCSAAGENQVVMDCDSFDLTQRPEMGTVSEITVKGRKNALKVVTLTC